MRKVLIVPLMLLLSVGLLGGSSDPRSVIPTVVGSEFQKEGLLGNSPVYSENAIDLINLIESRFDSVFDQKIPVDPNIYGKSEITIEEAFAIMARCLKAEKTYSVDMTHYGISEITSKEAFNTIGPFLSSSNLTGLDATNWTTSNPTSIWEAIDRLAVEVKTLKSGTID